MEVRRTYISKIAFYPWRIMPHPGRCNGDIIKKQLTPEEVEKYSHYGRGERVTTVGLMDYRTYIRDIAL